MAYIKQTWQTGEVITADKLNHIEDGIENNNPGFETVESEQFILDETVTVTVPQGAPSNGAQFEYSELINYPTITVDFNGDIYECELIKVPDAPFNAYGSLGASGPDFTEYPFVILSDEELGNTLFVENPGDYSVKIYVQESTINTTEDFEKSVTKIISEVEKNLEPLIVNCSDDGNSNTVFDKTFAEVRDAYFSGRAVLCGKSGVNSAFYSVMGFYAGSDNAYQITVANGIYPVIYTTDSENGYPSHHWTD